MSRKRDIRSCRREFIDFKLLTRHRKKHLNAVSPQVCTCPKPNLERSETQNRNKLNESILPFLNPSSDLVTEISYNDMPTDTTQITPEDIFHLLQEQNERFTERWTEQAAAFSKVLKTSLQTSAGTSKYNSVKLPTFSGKFNEDVNEFLTNFDRAANFHRP